LAPDNENDAYSRKIDGDGNHLSHFSVNENYQSKDVSKKSSYNYGKSYKPGTSLHYEENSIYD
jgi:hypothetical protein